MRITFTGTINHSYIMINAVKFRLPTGTIITVDRESTHYNIDNNGLYIMEWRNCYLWNIDDCNIFGNRGYYIEDESDTINEFYNLIAKADVYFELEDDVDEDYKVTIKSWNMY